MHPKFFFRSREPAKRSREDADDEPADNADKRPKGLPSSSWQVSAAPSKSSTETTEKVSSIKSKLSKPKGAASALSRPPAETAGRRAGLTVEERLAEQARHRAKAERDGKAVPYYRK